MKSVLVFLVIVGVSLATDDFYDGPPVRKCPPGEHSVLYCPQRAEPDCDNPKLHDKPLAACDIPDCFCNEPTVRNLSTGKCVKLENCPKKN